MKAVRFPSPDIDSMVLAEEEIPVPKDKEILLKIAFTAVNRADMLQRKGGYPPPPGESDIIGLEVSGTVHALGSNANRFKVGEKVMALLPGGGYAEYARVYEDHVMRIPAGLALREAAAIPEVWLTAFQLLRRVAHVKRGDFVLVHAAASGVGTAALQLLRHWGAVPMATVGSEAKAELCRSFGAQLVINRHEDANFDERVKVFTDGRGANIILDCIGGSYAMKNAQALALEGDWVLYGLMGGAEPNGPIFGHILAKRGRIVASTLRSRSVEYKAELIAGFEAEILPHISRDGQLAPVIDSVFPLEETNLAHKYVESNKNSGKVLLRVAGESSSHGEL